MVFMLNVQTMVFATYPESSLEPKSKETNIIGNNIKNKML